MKRLTFLIPLCLATPLAAQGTDLAALDRMVAEFTGAGIGQPGGAAQPLDRRLRLANCSSMPSLSWYGTRRDSVLVQCPDAGSWRVFVPVANPRSAPAEIAVQRGEAVTVSVAGDGFSVAQGGEAMDSGAVGTWIRVRTGTNPQPVRARIVRPGLVTIDMQAEPGNPAP